MIREEIEKILQNALEELHLPAGEISLEHPENAEHGDYSTNIALILGKQFKKNPQEIAEKIASAVRGQKSAIIQKVEALNGFVNLFVSKEYLVEELSRVVKEADKYGLSKKSKGKKVMVEFTDPNPFKEFHIGHLYSNIVGETLCRLFEANGAVVKRANYQGDVGVHVAKAIWGIQKLNADPHDIEALGKAYAHGAQTYESDPAAKKEIDALNKVIYERTDEHVNILYDAGRASSLEYFEQIYKRLGTKFDFYYFERDAGKKGLEIVREHLKKGIFQESEGAIIFPGEKYGLHSRVFINSQGLPTYEAKELGLAPTKYKDFKYDQSSIVTGNEIVEYFKVLLAALKQVYPDLGEKTKHVSHGMVRLSEGKMSSRTGMIIRGEDLLDETKSRVLQFMESSGSAIPQKERERAAELIAVGAVKYSLLRVSLGKDIIFDFEKSLSLQGDSGPYLQYTYARCRSILGKARSTNFEIRNSVELSKEELDLLRTIYKFPEVVQEAAEKYAPNLVCNFVFDLAQLYNNFYNTHSVLQADTEEQKHFRLLLTSAVAQLIQNSLSLLGIQTLEKM